MKTCTRCGVEFKGYTDWCADCMEVEGEVLHWPTKDEYMAQMQEDRWALIEPYYQEGKYDTEIGAIFGVTKYVIQEVRDKAGKPANKRADRYLWHDVEAQQAHAAQMVKHRKNVGRGSTPVV